MSNWVCPEHQQVKFVPPGVSNKTGKAYSGFFCCPVKGCEQRPPREPGNQRSQSPPVRAAGPAPKAIAPNWDKIAEGKCRSLAICAWIQSSLPLDQFWPIEKDVLTYMLTGAVPGFDERALDERWVDVPFAEE